MIRHSLRQLNYVTLLWNTDISWICHVASQGICIQNIWDFFVWRMYVWSRGHVFGGVREEWHNRLRTFTLFIITDRIRRSWQCISI